MSETVTIKGTKSGIILVLDESSDFDKLKNDVATKFGSAADFFGNASKAITFRGKKLSEEQKLELVDVIHNNCQLNIVCITEDNDRLEKVFHNSIESTLNAVNTELDMTLGQFYKGNLRSGQYVEAESSIIVLGNVNVGAKVVAKGNVIILGALLGTVYAGVDGNENAFIVALEMNPMQIRIADSLAKSSDDAKKKKKKKDMEAKIAFLENGSIYIEPLDKESLNDIKL